MFHLKIKSSSPLAQAQQQQDVATIDRFLAMVQSRVGPQLLNVLVKQDEVAKYVAKKLGVSTEVGKGYRALANINEDGGQEVPHLHFHLFGGEKVGKMVV